MSDRISGAVVRSHSSFLAIRSATGELDFVTPREHGGVDHYFRDQSDSALPWRGPRIALGSGDDVTAAVMLESNAAGQVAFHCVYREGVRVVHDWGERPPAIWHGPVYLPGSIDAAGSPALVESSPGRFEVVVAVAGGLAHWIGFARATVDASDRTKPPLIIDWLDPMIVPLTEAAEAVALLSGSFGNLEAVIRSGATLRHYWRDGESGEWFGPFGVASGVAGQHCWLEGTDGNFHLVFPLAGGGIEYRMRDNQTAELPWAGFARFGSETYDKVALVDAGNLEAIAMKGRRADHFWRDGSTGDWFGPFPVDSGLEPDPAVFGRNAVRFRAGIVGIHSAVLRTGRVLLFGFSDDDTSVAAARVVDPSNGSVAPTTNAGGHGGHGDGDGPPHIFCSGHAFLADGRLLVAGGHHLDIKSIHTFDPSTRAWSLIGQMPEGRWYPSCCPLPGGRVAIVGGPGGVGGTEQPVNNTIQIFDPVSNIGPESAIPNPFSRHFPAAQAIIDTYPIVLLLPSGKLMVHSRFATRFWNPGTGAWDAADLRTQHPFGRTYPGQGNGLLLPLEPETGYAARVMLIGGAGDEYQRIWWGVDATDTCEILDLAAPDPQWRFTSPMRSGRVMCDAVLLPDGKVLVTGGSRRGAALSGANPAFAVELFDPESETWTTIAPTEVPRMYYAAAVLLPDGRVMITGKDGPHNPFPYHYPEHRVEIYSPPYLFRGARPVISSAPAEIGYGGNFIVRASGTAGEARAVLMRPAATTHSVHMDQRLVALTMASRSGDEITFEGPPDSNVAPEGYYMLFLLNGVGVPSVARFVRLR